MAYLNKLAETMRLNPKLVATMQQHELENYLLSKSVFVPFSTGYKVKGLEQLSEEADREAWRSFDFR